MAKLKITDKFSIIDFAQDDLAAGLVDKIRSKFIYKDRQFNEDLYSAEHLLDLHLRNILDLTPEEVKIIEEIAELQAENESFYFRIITKL